jgi:hypothetical protein
VREQKDVARAHRRPKWARWARHYGAQVDLGLAQDTQAMLRLCSGLLRLAQVKAAVAHTKTEPAKGKINTESRGIPTESSETLGRLVYSRKPQ